MISKSQIKHIKALHTKKHREEEKVFIVEGIKSVLEIAKEKPRLIREIFATDSFISTHHNLLSQADIKFYSISENELLQISQLSNPNDALAVCNYFDNKTDELDLNSNFSFYLDDIRDPGNLGTIIRICSWFGVTDLYCSPTTVELYNPKCIQSAMGSFLRVKVHYVELEKLIHDKMINTIYATELNGSNIYKEQLKGGLIIIGNEANGIGDLAKRLATKKLTIPSASDNTESLNAAVATSIIASEFFRNKFD
jgi:RNA methyltransferase, TrmH family